MRKHAAILLAMVLAAPCLATAATDSAMAYATLTVEEVLTIELVWLSTGTDTVDLGTMLPDTASIDDLRMTVNHNLDAATWVQVSVSVNKTLGPVDNQDEVQIHNDDLVTLFWDDGTYGQVYDFPITGGAQSYTYDWRCTFVIYWQPTPGDRAYEMSFTVASL